MALKASEDNTSVQYCHSTTRDMGVIAQEYILCAERAGWPLQQLRPRDASPQEALGSYNQGRLAELTGCLHVCPYPLTTSRLVRGPSIAIVVNIGSLKKGVQCCSCPLVRRGLRIWLQNMGGSKGFALLFGCCNLKVDI